MTAHEKIYDLLRRRYCFEIMKSISELTLFKYRVLTLPSTRALQSEIKESA